MKLEHIALFVRISVLHNISQAGKELGLTPAVASSHMNRLEADLGVRLLHRTTRQVALTEEGQAFLPHAEQLLEHAQVARAAAGGDSLQPQGKLRIAAPASFGRMHLLPVLNAFLTKYPALDVDLHLSDSIFDMIEGGFDIAIRDAALADSSLIARKLAPVRRVVCAAPSYLEQYGEPRSLSDLADHDCVNLKGLETWSFATPEGEVKVKTRNRFLTDNGEAVRDACINGMGLTVSSTWCCYRQLASGELVEVLSDTPVSSHTSIWAVYPSARQLAPKVRVFVDYCVESFGDSPYWEQALHCE